jgi:hypothetical protein
MVSPVAVGELFVSSARVLTLRKLAEHAPQRMPARKTEAKIMEMHVGTKRTSKVYRSLSVSGGLADMCSSHFISTCPG